MEKEQKKVLEEGHKTYLLKSRELGKKNTPEKVAEE